MQSFASRIVILWGWRRALIAFLSGAFSSLALAPFHILPVFFVTFSILVWLLDGLGSLSGRDGSGASCLSIFKRFLTAAVIGWCFGFGYFLSCFHWLAFVMIGDGSDSQLLAFFEFFLALFLLSASMASGTVIAYLLWSSGGCRVFALAVGLTIGEWFRVQIPFEFPLNRFGEGLAAFESLMQFASIVGVQGLTFLCVLIFSSPSIIGMRRSDFREAVWFVPVSGSFLLFLIFIYGLWRIPVGDLPVFESVRLRVVQPHKAFWSPKEGETILSSYWALSDKATSPSFSGAEDVTHLIWPGAYGFFFPEDDKEVRLSLVRLLPPGTLLLMGAFRREAAERPGQFLLYDSFLAFDNEARLLAVYDRVARVPFGLFFHSLFDLLKIDFPDGLEGRIISGPVRSTIDLPGTPAFLPLIGPEIALSLGQDFGLVHPEWILNLGHGGMITLFAGSWQYLHRARLQAIEQGVSLVRAVGTGGSAIIDPYGRMRTFVPAGTRAVLDGRLPQPLPKTIFVKFGNWILFFMLFSSIFLVFVLRPMNR
ncbi:MAG: hypothetical protein PSN37_02860 [Alphaproteobacteria bacterium]|nr:hypothetical protein [Alphaproteobacteria bacterium]